MPRRWTRDLLDLLAECEVTPYKSSGPGGQKKNKTESSVRVRHLPTGIVRIATESRSQSANKLLALERIREALEARARKPKPRVATRPTAGSRERRLGEKIRRAQTKSGRRTVRTDDRDD
jgi:protein subunit release factor B